MVTGIFGLPGSGKTTYLASLAKKALRKGTKVYTTFYCKDCFTLDFSKLGKRDYSDCLILIDEISTLCDSRDWQKFTPELKYFFALHRHYGVDIVYCSQSYTDCDKKIRNITNDLKYITKFPFGFCRVRNIIKRFDIDNGGITERYDVSGLGTFVRLRKYWGMFDSFERKHFPDNTEVLWNSPIEG